jgi:S1-C subfamily serine protease
MRSSARRPFQESHLERTVAVIVLALGLCSRCLSAQLPPDTRGLLLRLYADSVLAIHVEIRKDDGTIYPKNGTGFIVDPSGFALTAAHLMGPAAAKRQITVRTRDRVNGMSFSAELIKMDEDLDIALIKLPDPYLAGRSWIPLQLGDSTGLSPWNSTQITVVAFNTVNIGLDTYQGSISSAPLNNGWLSLRGDALEPANSGGPAFNSSVQVIGWVVGGHAVSPGSPPSASYIAPINFARGILSIAGVRYF